MVGSGRGGTQDGGDDGWEWYSGDQDNQMEGLDSDKLALGAGNPLWEVEAMVETSGGGGEFCLCCFYHCTCCRLVFLCLGTVVVYHSSAVGTAWYWIHWGSI